MSAGKNATARKDADMRRDAFDDFADQLREMWNAPVYFGPKNHSVWNFVPYTGVDILSLGTAEDISFDNLRTGEALKDPAKIVMYIPLHILRSTTRPIPVTRSTIDTLEERHFPHRLVTFDMEDLQKRANDVPEFPFPEKVVHRAKVGIYGKYTSLRGDVREGCLLELPKLAYSDRLFRKMCKDIRFSELRMCHYEYPYALAEGPGRREWE